MVAVVDCTGHGVPGAFMSSIGNALLNEMVIEKSIIVPGKVLDGMRDGVIRALKQGPHSISRDGMDMSLVHIDYSTKLVQFSGAGNPLWIVRNDTILEIKGDKQPVAYAKFEMTPFTTHTVDLVEGDQLYMFSDGFPDQFGGPKGKKYKYKTLKSFLISIRDISMKSQEYKLLEGFESWKGDLEQVDDVCVIGIRVG